MKPFVIAEGGVNHLGDFKLAKRMINLSKAVGCDAIKFQAYRAESIADPKHPNWNLYKEVEFSLDQHMELIDHGNSISMTVFYSIFSEEYEPLKDKMKYHKYAARQYNHKLFRKEDNSHSIFSIPKRINDLPKTKYNQIMHVTDYMTCQPHLERIDQLRNYFNRPVGYSDHTQGIAAILEASNMGAHIIEKHFYIKRPVNLKFRDFEHGIDWQEMDKFIRRIKR